jgi:hypothetical protein
MIAIPRWGGEEMMATQRKEYNMDENSDERILESHKITIKGKSGK